MIGVIIAIVLIATAAFWGYWDGLNQRKEKTVDGTEGILEKLLSDFDTFNNKELAKGNKGESIIRKEIARWGSDYLTLHDVLLPFKERTTQIDHIVISAYGVFCIENKNMKGLIVGNEKSQKWKQVLYKNKEEFLNPIIQNKVHIKAILHFISDILEEEEIHNIVVFSDEAKLNVTSNEPVLSYSELRQYIKKYNFKVFTKEEVYAMCSIIDVIDIKDKKIRRAHVKTIKQRAIKREISVEHGVCPYCQGNLIHREGQYGSFMGCENYPRCKFTIK